MEQQDSHIKEIQMAFAKMKSNADLLALLNMAKPLVYGVEAKPFKLKQLTFYSNPKLGGKRYIDFTIKKKSGGDRTIHAPEKGLKALQKTLAYILQTVYEPHKAAMGFVTGKSIVDNANLHIGRKYVYNVDLKDFFPSIDQARVWKCLQLRPFNLNDKDLGENSNLPPNNSYHLKITDKLVLLPYVSYEMGYLNGVWKIDLNKWTLDGKAIGGKIVYAIKEHSIFIFTDTSILTGLESLLRENKLEYSESILFKYINLLINKDQQKLKSEVSRLQLANRIAAICCTEMEVERLNSNGEWERIKRNVLPQGAPTSPILTNIVCQRLDFLLTGVAKRFGLTYSRYADDITFSSMHNVYQKDSDFINELHRIIAEQGFHIKESKTRLQKEGYRQEVTGLLVNEKSNVQHRYIKQLRMWLYNWERYGYKKAYLFFLNDYFGDKGHNVDKKPNMLMVIAGKLDYLKMVKGADNELYQKLKERFNRLSGEFNYIESILDIWEHKGIDQAMEIFYAPKKGTNE
jgi:retron-type reverse transcriptase